MKIFLRVIFSLLFFFVPPLRAEEVGSYDFAPPADEKEIPHKITLSFLQTKGEVGGWIQLDKNGFLTSPEPRRQHLVRRLRLYVTTTSHDLVRTMFMVQGDRDYWNYHYIYADILKPEWFQLRVGLFKKPFGLEALYSSRYFWMVNRSLGTVNYLVLLDIGVGAHGFLWNGKVEYGIGGFNGNERNLKNNPHKLFCARAVWIPFYGEKTIFEQLRLGSSCSTCQKEVRLGSFATGSETSFLSWNSLDTRAKSGKLLFGADMEWIYRAAALRAEAILVNWGKVRALQISSPFTGYSWYVEGSYLLTGENLPRNNPLFPRRNFHLCRGGGAFELLARYEAFQADHKVIKKGLATGSSYASGVTLAANYYFNPFILMRLDWQFTNFHKDIAVKDHFTRNESVITCRLQGEF